MRVRIIEKSPCLITAEVIPKWNMSYLIQFEKFIDGMVIKRVYELNTKKLKRR